MQTALLIIRTIEAVPRTIQMLVADVERRTGYPVLVLWGGPQVNDRAKIGTWQFVMPLINNI